MGGRTVWNSEGKGGLRILEFPKPGEGLDEDAARGKVWIFSGITHLTAMELQKIYDCFMIKELPVQHASDGTLVK